MMVPNQIIKYNEISEDYKAHLIMISNKYFDTRDNFCKLPILGYPLLDGASRHPSKKESTNLTIIICILSWEEGFRNQFFPSLILLAACRSNS